MRSEPLRHPSLRLRVLAPAALVAIPAIALILYVSFDHRQDAERAVTATAARLAGEQAVHVSRLISGTRDLLIAISRSRDVRERNSELCSAYLRHIVPRLDTTYTNIGVLDAEGTSICSGFTPVPTPLADRAYYTRAVDTKAFVVGDYMIGRKDGKPSIPFSYPIVDGAGQVRIVAFATLDLEWLNGRLNLDGWPQDATVIITDRRSAVIAMNANGVQWLGTSLAADPITALIGERRSGVVEFTEQGVVEVVAFERVLPLESGLTVRVLLSKAEAIAAGNRLMHHTLLGLGLVALFVILGVTVASDRLLVRPIADLTKATRRLAAGDLGARAASSTTIPELHELGKDFDAMAAGLEERESARLRAELERKELEEQYHQAQKMDAVGRLAGGIAHDFNNMLTAILGYCELLLEDPAVPDAQREDIREIEKAGKTAAQLTRQLLAFSRREIIQPTILDLNAIVTSVVRMLHRLVGEHIAMETRLADGLHAMKADRSQVEQVILNLALNARDAMPGGGRLLIETANVHLDTGVPNVYLGAPAGDYVLLSVSDNGTGIAPDVLPHLFEPFFTTKGTGKGTGLGLPTIYGIVKQSNGGILVESHTGGGSIFKIFFPRSDGSAAAAAAVEEASRQILEKKTILIVEDDEGIRELASRVLERHGYRVLVANGGQEASDVCDRFDGAVDVLLSDVVMPGMNGPAVAAMLTAIRPDMKVVFMSGYTDDTVVRHGVMKRDVPFLPKPFTPEGLANKIAEVLG